MNTFALRLGVIGITLLTCASVAQSAATLNAISKACSSEDFQSSRCLEDFQYGNPAFSSIIRRNLYVPADGGLSGWDYAGEANAKASLANFGMYARATGQRHDLSSFYGGPSGMTAAAQVRYHDEITVAGTGFGTIVVPWHVTGGFLLVAHGNDSRPPQGTFTTFCQSIPLGAVSGLGCSGYGAPQQFYDAVDVDQVLMLRYTIRFGVTYSLNTSFKLDVYSGSGLITGMEGDFSHTGRQQPASVYDNSHNLIQNPMIISASGVDYLNPQAAPVPEPASLVLLVSGLLALGWRARPRRAPATDPGRGRAR